MIGLAFGALSALGTIGQFAGNMMGNSVRRLQQQDQIRALEMKKASTLGLASAKSGASGVEGTSSSTLDYLKGLGAEFDRAIAIQKETARNVNTAGNITAIANLFGGAGSTLSGLGNLNNWKFD